MRNKSFILEGPDCVGKTTLANLLREKYNLYYIHNTFYKDEEKMLQQFVDTYAKVDDALRHNDEMQYIIDRMIISNDVYGDVYHDGKHIDEKVRAFCNTLHYSADVITIFCLPEKEKWLSLLKEKVANGRDEMYVDGTDFEKISLVYDKFYEIYKKFTEKYLIKNVIRFDMFQPQKKIINAIEKLYV